MKSKLPNEDELYTKYILNELDPSEEIIVENAMLSDENALIEVESLRSTYKKIQSLPQFTAPQKVLDNIIRLAANSGRKISVWRMGYPVRWAAAALILLSAGFGYMLMNPLSDLEEGAPAQAVIGTESPWIDNRNILHINNTDQIRALQSADSINAGKLLPLGDSPSSDPTRVRDVQLTGTSK